MPRKTADKHTNKLSIYLIKEGTKEDQIIDTSKAKEKEKISNVGNLYYGLSSVKEPEWVKNFFGEKFNNKRNTERMADSHPCENKIFSASTRAALVIKSERRFFVISFGHGHHLINKEFIEKDFGLKTVINTIGFDKFRKVDRVSISNLPKHTSEQMTKAASFFEFEISTEQDLVQKIMGEVREDLIPIFGKAITGKDALSISPKIGVSDIKEFLSSCYEQYKSDAGKDLYFWINKSCLVSDQETIEDLNKKLINNINANDKVWIAVPEIIDWEEISKFNFGDSTFSDKDISLDEYIALSKKQKIVQSEESLKSNFIEALDGDGNTVKEWNVYQCLYCEADTKDGMHVLINGEWYRINSDFSKEINDHFSTNFASKTPSVTLPNSVKGEKENQYNKRVGEEEDDIFTMDGNLVSYGGQQQQIEFCDLFTLDNKIIHVKRYKNSSILSHLFAQGLVSGALFLQEQEFRKELNKALRRVLPDWHQLPEANVNPNPGDYHIVYAIIKPGELDIPFFSKVNFKHCLEKLKRYGYKVSLIQIGVDGD